MMKNKKYSEKERIDLKVIITLSRCFQSVRRAEEVWIKEKGVTLAQFGVIELLYHKGEMNVREIIKKTLSTAGNMTVVIDNLEKEGYITRDKNKNDKREYIIRISEKGNSFIESFFPEHIKNISKLLSVLTEEEKNKLTEILKKLGKSI